MKIVKKFSTERKLIEYLEQLYSNSYTPDEYYSKLEVLADDGCVVDGKEWDYNSLCEIF